MVETATAPDAVPEARTARMRYRVKGTKSYVRSMESGYDGASRGRRLLDWMPRSDAVNKLTLSGLQWQRDRSRDLVRKVPWVTSGVDSLTANIIGDGIRPMPNVTDTAWRAKAIEVWNDWVNEADAYGIVNFYGMQTLAVHSMIESGEVFIRIRKRLTTDGLTVPLQLQIVEAEHVPLDKNVLAAPGQNKIIAGIEFDSIGRRVAYWMYPEHPGESLASGGTFTLLPTRVPASEVIHLYKPLRPGQVRGVPWIAPVILRTRDLLEYEDAEIVRKKTAAMFAGFITQMNPEGDPLGTDGADHDETPLAALEPGTMQVLDPGEDVKFSSPAEVGGSYEAFMQMNLRAISAGLGTTYEQMSGDLRGVNFSSIRAGLNEFQRRITPVQDNLVAFLMCRPVWEAVIGEAIATGVLPAPAGYMKNAKPWLRADWVAPGWRYVNPAQELAAEKDAIRSGLSSRQKVARSHGDDVEIIDKQNAEDQARADAAGLVYDTDPRKVSVVGVGQSVTPGEGDTNVGGAGAANGG